MIHDLRFDSGEGLNREGLIDRVLAGEVFVFRDALQHFGLFELIKKASLDGIRASLGEEAARRAEEEGFEHIHEWTDVADIPTLTDAVYDTVRPTALDVLQKFVSGAFPDAEILHYEETPNVRFHIPYDLAKPARASFEKFTKAHGEGKIAAHGPHRDSWLDCPSNGVNLWFAIGPVRHGNGLTIFQEDYDRDFKYKRSGDIADGEKLHKATTFDLDPGDVIVFHTDHMHGSELNRIDETRFVISYRMTFGKPHFPNLHYHTYTHAGLAASSLKAFATFPARMQASYLRSFPQRIAEKLSPPTGPDQPAREPEMLGVRDGDKIRVPLASVPVGAVRGVDERLCVARLSETECVALSRRCPHKGGDLSNGWVDGRNVVCAWHNLPFDADTGQSPCKSLRALKRIPCVIDGEDIFIPADAVEQVTTGPEPADANV